MSNPEIQDEATKAFKSLCDTYYGSDHLSHGVDLNQNSQIILELKQMLKPSMSDPSNAVTRGYNMAFGVLSKEILGHVFPELIDTVLTNSIPKGQDNDDAESRKQTLKSILQIIQTFGVTNVPV